MKFKHVYDAFKLLYPNPDTCDVLQFMYVYEQIEKGRDLNEIDEETEEYMVDSGYRYPPGYKAEVRSRN